MCACACACALMRVYLSSCVQTHEILHAHGKWIHCTYRVKVAAGMCTDVTQPAGGPRTSSMPSTHLSCLSPPAGPCLICIVHHHPLLFPAHKPMPHLHCAPAAFALLCPQVHTSPALLPWSQHLPRPLLHCHHQQQWVRRLQWDAATRGPASRGLQSEEMILGPLLPWAHGAGSGRGGAKHRGCSTSEKVDGRHPSSLEKVNASMHLYRRTNSVNLTHTFTHIHTSLPSKGIRSSGVLTDVQPALQGLFGTGSSPLMRQDQALATSFVLAHQHFLGTSNCPSQHNLGSNIGAAKRPHHGSISALAALKVPPLHTMHTSPLAHPHVHWQRT